MRWTCENSECTSIDPEEGLLWSVSFLTASDTRNTTSGEMTQEFRIGFRREPADRTELFEMVTTSNDRNLQVVNKQE